MERSIKPLSNTRSLGPAMAAAVSVAVVVGAVAGCSADDDLAPVPAITAAQMAAADPESGPEPDPDRSGAATLTDPEPAADEPDAREPEPDRPEKGLELPPATAVPPPASTGPVLEWTEIDPGFDDLFKLESVGDGRVIARAWTNGDGAFFGQRIVVSANGTDWTEVPIPEDLFPEQVNISADRWAVTGRIPGVGLADLGPDLLFFSDDQGATWTEAAIDIPAEAFSPYAGLSLRASSVLVSGKQIVVPLLAFPSFDGQALLDDLGLLPPGKKVIFSLPNSDGVSFTLIDADAPYPYSDLTSTAFSLVSAYGALVVPDAPDVAYDELDLTHDEVGLTFDEVSGLSNPLSNPFDVLQTRLYVSDGASGEVASSLDALTSSAAGTGEGYVLIVVDDSGETVLISPDGFVWSEGPSLGPGFFGGTVSADGTIWTVRPGAGRSLAIQRAAPGRELATVATIEGLRDPGLPVVGPAGLVLTATAVPGVSPVLSNEPVVSRISRDGYELRYNEPEGGLSLWNLDEDRAVYVFGPEDVQSGTPPDGVRQVGEGQSIGLAFEDPDTGADLVTFTGDDMAFLLGMAAAQSGGAADGDAGWPEQWVGWSADGSRWGWESLAAAFGIDDATVWPEFAVGQDFVIARVAPWATDPGDVSRALPTRWFLATVP